MKQQFFLATVTTMECIKMILRLNCVTDKIYNSSKSELNKLISKQINSPPHLIISKRLWWEFNPS